MKINLSSKRFKGIVRIGVIITLLLTLFFVQSSTIQAEYNASISVISVVPNAKITMALSNLPKNSEFVVQMGQRGTAGIGGYYAASFATGTEAYSEKTFSIPTPLYDEAMIDVRITGDNFALSTFFVNTGTVEDPDPDPSPGGYGGIPTTSIKNVVPGDSVTVRTYNFPAGKDFVVYMGEFGTRGVGGIESGAFYSAGGGSFELTFTIPEALTDEHMIAIRLQTPGNTYYAYDWFYNQPYQGSSGSVEVSDPEPADDGEYHFNTLNLNYSGYPTTSILSNEDKESVEVKVYNLPKDVDFSVTVGAFGTRGVGGATVASFNSGDGGTQTFTFDVPDTYKEYYKLAIRLDSGYWYAYDWWVNNPAAAGASSSSSSTSSSSSSTCTTCSIPSTSFVSLNADGSVTFMAYNFEPNTQWQVTMGAYGTRGVNGVFVQTLTSKDGSFTIKSEIPTELKDLEKIAIRFEQVDGPYYAYDWFVNN